MERVESSLPTLAGRYHLRELLGQGGMGAVYLAEDEVLGRQVAIKQIIPTSGTDDRERAITRLIREARSAARIHHPHVVTVHDVLTVEDQTYVIMEYVDAVNLAQLIRRDGPLEPRRAARIAAQIADALNAAHRLGVIHRDIKPANILVADGDQAKLADFGVALASDDPRLTSAGNLVGSVLFMAPEVAQGGAATPASDLYSLGSTLFTVIEGHAPFGPNSAQVSATAVLTRLISRPAPRAESAGPVTPIITALLSSNPAQRPDAEQTRLALLRAAAAPSATATPTMPPQSAPSQPPAALSQTRLHTPAAPMPPGGDAARSGRAASPAVSATPPVAPAPSTPAPAVQVSAAQAPAVEVPTLPTPESAAASAAKATPKRRRRRRLLLVGAILSSLILATAGIWIANEATFWQRFAGHASATCPGPAISEVTIDAANGVLTASLTGKISAPNHAITINLNTSDDAVVLGWYSWSYHTQAGELVVVKGNGDFLDLPAPTPSVHNNSWRVAIPLEKFPHQSPLRASVSLDLLDSQGAGTSSEYCSSTSLIFG
jgi:serine/threonine protein kinase